MVVVLRSKRHLEYSNIGVSLFNRRVFLPYQLDSQSAKSLCDGIVKQIGGLLLYINSESELRVSNRLPEELAPYVQCVADICVDERVESILIPLVPTILSAIEFGTRNSQDAESEVVASTNCDIVEAALYLLVRMAEFRPTALQPCANAVAKIATEVRVHRERKVPCCCIWAKLIGSFCR